MRWEDLFCDLEAQLDAAEAASWQADVSDQARAERADILLEDRLRGCRSPLRLRLVDGSRLVAEVADAGDGWVLLRLLAGARPPEVVVPVPAIAEIADLPGQVDAVPGEVSRRLRLNAVLRGLVRRRSVVEVRLAGGTVLVGTLDAVGRDHLDLAEHPADQPRRQGNVTAQHTVRSAAVVSLSIV